MSKPIKIVVLGAGGHAAEVCAYVAALEQATGTVRLAGCIDDHKPVGRSGLVNVLGDFRHLGMLLERHHDIRCITATGDNILRRLFVARAEALVTGPFPWWTAVHPTASVGPDVEIGSGTCVAPGSIVTTRVHVGRHGIVNVRASISHDATIGDFVNLNPGVVVAGNARVGDGCYIGAGATIIDKVNVGQGTIVGAGAVVVEDLPANATAVGVPARVIKYHTASWEPALVSRRA